MKLLKTERLIVRNFKPEDWRDLQAYVSQKEVTQYDHDYPSTDEDCKGIAEYFSKGSGFWAACLKDNGKMIGAIIFEMRYPVQGENLQQIFELPVSTGAFVLKLSYAHQKQLNFAEQFAHVLTQLKMFPGHKPHSSINALAEMAAGAAHELKHEALVFFVDSAHPSVQPVVHRKALSRDLAHAHYLSVHWHVHSMIVPGMKVDNHVAAGHKSVAG